MFCLGVGFVVTSVAFPPMTIVNSFLYADADGGILANIWWCRWS